MMLDVTQKHIDRGIRQNCGRCPIAEALKDAGFISPLASGLRVGGPGNWGRCTNVVARFMVAFDIGRPVKPHRFRIPGLVKPKGESK